MLSMIARGKLNRAAIDTCLAGSGRMSVALRSRHPLPSPPVSATSPPMPRDYFQRRRYNRRITSAAMVGVLSALVAWALTRQPAAPAFSLSESGLNAPSAGFGTGSDAPQQEIAASLSESWRQISGDHFLSWWTRLARMLRGLDSRLDLAWIRNR